MFRVIPLNRVQLAVKATALTIRQESSLYWPLANVGEKVWAI